MSEQNLMRIEKIIENKKQFLDLLLLADEQENMIDKYLPNKIVLQKQITI